MHTMSWVDTVIGIAGHARSGKSTLARALADRAGGTVVGFGDLVRQSALARGEDPSDRRTLVATGQEWAQRDPAGLCAAALSSVGEGCEVLILDGIRHITVLDELERVLTALHLVYLTASEELISNRIAGSYDPRQDPSERDMVFLEQRAEIVLDAGCAVADLVDEVWRAVPWLQLQRMETEK